MTVYIFIILSSIIFSFLEIMTSIKKNKVFKEIQYIYIFFIIWLYIKNTTRFDYLEYIRIFELVPYFPNLEKGYEILIVLLKEINISYLGILSIASFLFLYVFFIKYRISYIFSFLLFYFPYYFLYDFPQTRNLIMILIFMLGLSLKANLKIRFFITFLASQIHRLGNIYFLYFIIERIKRKYVYLLIIIVNLGVLLFVNYLPNMLGLIYNKTKVLSYFGNNPINYIAYLYGTLDVVLEILLVKFICKDSFKLKNKYERFIVFSLFFIGGGLYNLETIGRIWRNTSFIRFYYYSNIIFKKISIKRRLLLLYLLSIKMLIFILLKFSGKNIQVFIDLINQLELK